MTEDVVPWPLNAVRKLWHGILCTQAWVVQDTMPPGPLWNISPSSLSCSAKRTNPYPQPNTLPCLYPIGFQESMELGILSPKIHMHTNFLNKVSITLRSPLPGHR